MCVGVRICDRFANKLLGVGVLIEYVNAGGADAAGGGTQDVLEGAEVGAGWIGWNPIGGGGGATDVCGGAADV